MTQSVEDLLPEERRRLILDSLADRGSVRVKDLTERFQVAPVTIRRDLDLLCQRDLVQRVHGGVTLKRPDPVAFVASATSEVAHSDAGTPSTTLASAPNPAGDDAPVIGMVVPSIDYYWPLVAQAAKNRAAERNLKLLLRESQYSSPEKDREQIEHLVKVAKVDGLLLTVDTGSETTLQMLDDIAALGTPIVLVERSALSPKNGSPMESVTSDHYSGAIAAVAVLRQAGHERIGIVSPVGSPTSPQLRLGWEHACRDRGVEPEATLDFSLDTSTPEALARGLDKVLDQCMQRGITALMVHADPEANSMVQAAQRRGLNVPDDLSIVAYDDEVASLFTPALTAVRPPRNTLGRVAVDLLADRLQDPARPVRRVIVAPRLTVRESTAPPRGRSE